MQISRQPPYNPSNTTIEYLESVTMATFPISMRRLIFAGGFAVAAATAPAIAAFAVPMSSGPAVACPTGEEEDPHTGVCPPHRAELPQPLQQHCGQTLTCPL